MGHTRIYRRSFLMPEQVCFPNSVVLNVFVPFYKSRYNSVFRPFFLIPVHTPVKQAQGMETFPLSCACACFTNFTVQTGCLRLLYTCEPGFTVPGNDFIKCAELQVEQRVTLHFVELFRLLVIRVSDLLLRERKMRDCFFNHALESYRSRLANQTLLCA